MTKQYKYQLNHFKKGLCIICPKKADKEKNKRYCKEHRLLRNKLQMKKYYETTSKQWSAIQKLLETVK